MSISRRMLLGIALAGAALALHDNPVRAQTADALGHPLPKKDLAIGTMTVRLVVGEMSSPVAGADVRITVDGVARTARTDASGRAKFTGLTPGAKVKAAAAGESGEVSSVEFPIPPDTGVAVLLSTVPWKGGAADAMTPNARPDPRVMSGQGRPSDEGDAPGQITVRLSYDRWDDPTGTVDRPVVMVAYSSDDRVAAKVVKSDAAGRAVFTGLDTTGNTAYYALTLLPRDGKDDRLLSVPVIPQGDVGMRLMLSAEKLESGLPPIDDLEKSVPQGEIPPGQVVVAFGGAPEKDSKVELYDLIAKKVVATVKATPSRAIPSTIAAQLTNAKANPKLANGTVAVMVAYAADNRAAPLPGIPVTIRAAAAKPPPPPKPDPKVDPKADPKPPNPHGTPPNPHGATPDPAPVVVPPPPPPPPKFEVEAELGTFDATAISDDNGDLSITGVPTGIWLEAVTVVEGKTFVGKPFVLEPDAGGAELSLAATWRTRGQFEAVFDGVTPTPAGAYLVEARMHEQVYRSPPFQVTPGRGIGVPIYVFPRVAMTFQLDATVEDDFLATRGSFVVQNFSFAPYAGPAEGVRIPAPVGATGLVVGEKDKQWVSAEATEFRLLRPVPPFGGTFRAAFSIPLDEGNVTWDMALPFGTYQSSLAIMQTPRMKVTGLPARSKTKVVGQPNGTSWFAIQDVLIGPNKRMTFRVTGLPQQPAWQRIARITAGLAAVLVLGAGLFFAVRRGVKATPAPVQAAQASRKKRKKRIEELLDQVAALDREKARPADGPLQPVTGDGRREVLVRELEALYLEEGDPAAKAGAS